MDTNTLGIFCNLIPALLIIVFVIDGWNKGALSMLVNLVRFIVSYFLTRVLSRMIASFIISTPFIKSQLANVALNYSDSLNKMFGVLIFLTGQSLQNNLENVMWWLVYTISFIILFSLMMIFFSVVVKISLKANKVPVVGKVNKIIGGLEGLVFGTVLTLLLVYIAAFVLEIFGYTSISQAFLSSWLPTLFLRFVK